MVLTSFVELGERFLAHRHATRIAGVDDEERLDLLVFELLDLVVSELEAVLLRRLDVDHLEVVVLEVRHF